MSNRKVITKDELSAWLTNYVALHEDCEGTTVNVQYKLQKPDPEGCNWSDSVIFNPGKNADKDTLTGIVGSAVREARDKFNIE